MRLVGISRTTRNRISISLAISFVGRKLLIRIEYRKDVRSRRDIFQPSNIYVDIAWHK